MKSCKWSERDFAYFLADIIALRGNVEWKQNIQSLLWGFDANCENCDASIDILIAENPSQAWCGEINKRTALTFASTTSFNEIPQWIRETACNYEQPIVADWIASFLYGSGTCPQCGASFEVSEMYEQNNS